MEKKVKNKEIVINNNYSQEHLEELVFADLTPESITYLKNGDRLVTFKIYKLSKSKFKMFDLLNKCNPNELKEISKRRCEICYLRALCITNFEEIYNDTNRIKGSDANILLCKKAKESNFNFEDIKNKFKECKETGKDLKYGPGLVHFLNKEYIKREKKNLAEEIKERRDIIKEYKDKKPKLEVAIKELEKKLKLNKIGQEEKQQLSNMYREWEILTNDFRNRKSGLDRDIRETACIIKSWNK